MSSSSNYQPNNVTPYHRNLRQYNGCNNSITPTSPSNQEYTAQTFSFNTTNEQNQNNNQTSSYHQSSQIAMSNNPYKKKNNRNNFTYRASENNTNRNNRPAIIRDDDEDQYINKKKPSTRKLNVDEKQRHPHLAGRIRPHREFDTSLEISSSLNNDNDKSSLTPLAIKDDCLYDTDDEDDKLLSYVAFSSSRS